MEPQSMNPDNRSCSTIILRLVSLDDWMSSDHIVIKPLTLMIATEEGEAKLFPVQRRTEHIKEPHATGLFAILIYAAIIITYPTTAR